MEANVDGVYFGTSELFLCNGAVFSKHSIKLSLSNSKMEEESKDLLILKRNILDLRAPLQAPTPFLSLKLKDSACQHIKDLFKLDEFGIKFNSRSKDSSEVWMIIFYHLTSFEFAKFLFKNYFDARNFIPSDEIRDFLYNSTEARRMLFTLGHIILSIRQKYKEPMADICHRSSAILISIEDRITAKKLVSYFTDIKAGKAVEGNEFEVGFQGEAFSTWDLKEMVEYYRSSLWCEKCKVEAMLKCQNCKVTRYCNKPCQVEDFPRHTIICSTLKQKRKRNELLARQVIEHPKLLPDLQNQLENWGRRADYKVWEKKFTHLVNHSVRESIVNSLDICLIVNGVDTFMKI